MKKRHFFAFVQDLKEELKKVSWTTQDELKFSTKMVVGTTFFLGMGIYLVDLMIKSCLDLVTLFVHFIFGSSCYFQGQKLGQDEFTTQGFSTEV